MSAQPVIPQAATACAGSSSKESSQKAHVHIRLPGAVPHIAEGHVGQRHSGGALASARALRRYGVVTARGGRFQHGLPGHVREDGQLRAALGVDVAPRLVGGVLADLGHHIVAGLAVAHGDRDGRGAVGSGAEDGRCGGSLLQDHPVAEHGAEAESRRRRRRRRPACRGSCGGGGAERRQARRPGRESHACHRERRRQRRRSTTTADETTTTCTADGATTTGDGTTTTGDGATTTADETVTTTAADETTTTTADETDDDAHAARHGSLRLRSPARARGVRRPRRGARGDSDSASRIRRSSRSSPHILKYASSRRVPPFSSFFSWQLQTGQFRPLRQQHA
eukprot:SAG22_NODE_1298_length_4811_cov_3.430178_2_plen_339_part_00